MKNKIVIKFPPAAGTVTAVSIGRGEASKFLKKTKQAYIVADRKLAVLFPSLFPPERVFFTEGGEEAKSLAVLEGLLEWLSDNRCKRTDEIIAVGGGTVGDLAGFAAAVYMRGMRWSVIPTTLLSMVDSSVGGKTAVNIGGVKNLAGAFHQPDRVVIDPGFLVTLPEREYMSGMGEIIKTAAIADKQLFSLLLKRQDEITGRGTAVMEEIIAACCGYKGGIVGSDAREGGKRVLLNAGHTVAHAIESDSRYTVPHGQAVATGLYLETRIGEKLKYTEKNTAARIASLLSLYSCPVSYSPTSLENFINSMHSDKKQHIEGIHIPFVEKIGKAVVRKMAPDVFYGELRALYKGR